MGRNGMRSVCFRLNILFDKIDQLPNNVRGESVSAYKFLIVQGIECLTPVKKTPLLSQRLVSFLKQSSQNKVPSHFLIRK